MHKDWQTLTSTLPDAMARTRQGIPDTTKAFGTLASAATASGALDGKSKELIALAISTAMRCDGCIGFHAKAASRQEATREEVLETIGMAIYMGGGPSFTYGAQTLEAFDQFSGG